MPAGERRRPRIQMLRGDLVARRAFRASVRAKIAGVDVGHQCGGIHVKSDGNVDEGVQTRVDLSGFEPRNIGRVLLGPACQVELSITQILSARTLAPKTWAGVSRFALGTILPDGRATAFGKGG